MDEFMQLLCKKEKPFMTFIKSQIYHQKKHP